MYKKKSPYGMRRMRMSTVRKKRKVEVHKEDWHGTINGYTNLKCRCDDCRAAMSAYMREYRQGRFTGQKCTNKIRGKRCRNPASVAAGNGLCFSCNATKVSKGA
jgi:hypothetical protein